MKNKVHHSLFFLSNPLKVAEAEPASASSEKKYQTPYLKALLTSRKPSAKVYSINGISNMINKSVKRFVSKIPKNIETSEKEWFNNYE